MTAKRHKSIAAALPSLADENSSAGESPTATLTAHEAFVPVDQSPDDGALVADKKSIDMLRSHERAVCVPLADSPGTGHVPRRIDVALDYHHGLTLRKLLRALEDRGERLASGMAVKNYQHAVRWLLEQAEGDE